MYYATECSVKVTWFPHGLEKWKTFSSQEILNRLEKSGDFTQNAGKVNEF